jgi:hypothetical protein
MLLKYKKIIEIEDHGNYEIEVTNFVNANSMRVQPLIPSLMSSDNLRMTHSIMGKPKITAPALT